MKQKELIQHVKQAIFEVEPNAEVILYGSRSRGDFNNDSDWDFLILVDRVVSDKQVDCIRHRLYEIEWQAGEVISSIIRSRQEWNSPLYQVMPLHQRIEQEGIKV
ncbi:MAG: nucleotidyltransferase domain-containing protein [SAR324 cluster bacterium]|nr:nucleotidyltransferase domain-containing protein [SAR324 cluster bacterium]